MRRSRSPLQVGVAVLLASCLLGTMSGCGEHLGLLNYWMYGMQRVEPQFAGLEGKRVAVVCLDGNSLSGPSDDAARIAQAVTTTLGYKVPDIQIVRQPEIADWLDTQDQDLTDYRDVGRGVKADMVVGIDMLSFSIHEGQTLLKGRSKVGVKVFDMTKGGQVVYESPAKEISWPESGARHVTEDEGNFRTTYLYILADRIARDFYAYEAIQDVALDAKNLAN
jgi:hypothetical protein